MLNLWKMRYQELSYQGPHSKCHYLGQLNELVESSDQRRDAMWLFERVGAVVACFPVIIIHLKRKFQVKTLLR